MTQEFEGMAFTAEGEPNPYGKEKGWQEGEVDTGLQTADSLFVPPKRNSPPANTDTGEQHDWKKRFGDQTTHYDQTKVKLTETETKLADMTAKFEALSKGEVQSGDDNQPPITAPEVAPTPPVAEPNADPTIAALQEQLAELTKESSTNKQKTAQSKIREAHSDFDELKSSNEFHEWAKTKSPVIQSAIYRNPNDYVSAIEALDLYKFESAKVAQAKELEQQASQSQEDASSLVPSHNTAGADEGNQPKMWKTSEINRVTKDPKLLYQYIDEINLAQSEGRIIKDT